MEDLQIKYIFIHRQCLGDLQMYTFNEYTYSKGERRIWCVRERFGGKACINMNAKQLHLEPSCYELGLDAMVRLSPPFAVFLSVLYLIIKLLECWPEINE